MNEDRRNAPLIRLADGTWIDPTLVTEIVPCKKQKYPDGFEMQHHVIVRWAIYAKMSSAYTKIEFGTYDEAKNYADDIGSVINHARARQVEP